MTEVDDYPPLQLNRSMPMGGRVAIIVFGSFFVLFSILFLVITRTPGGEIDPQWIADTVGVIFLMLGLILIASGVRGVLVDRRLRGTSAREREQWMAGQPWDRLRARDRLSGGFSRSLFGIGFVALFLSPFHYLLWEAFQDSVMVGLILGAFLSLFDIILVVGLVTLLYQLMRRMKYGRSTVYFDTFPFTLSDALIVHFEPPRQLDDFEHLVCTLRCLTQSIECRGENAVTVCKEYWSSEQKIERLDVGRQLDLQFKPPGDLPESALANSPPVYWELEIRAETSGIDYRAIFTLPVYTRRSTAPKAERDRDLPRASPDRVEPELQRGEITQWSGRGNPGWRNVLPLTPIVLFAIPWTAFSVSWVGSAVWMCWRPMGADDALILRILFPLFGVPFVLIGLGALSLPFWVYRAVKREVYLVTDRRVLCVGGLWRKKVQIFEPEQLSILEVTPRPDESGDIAIGGGRPIMWGVQRVEEVATMIRELAREPEISEGLREQR